MKTDIARLIEHTLLKPEATEGQIRQLCQEGLEYGFAAICVNPVWVKLCSQLMNDSGVIVCSVSGFPLGANLTEVKAHEAQAAVQVGAREIDMVINVGMLKSGQDYAVRDDIERVARAVHAGGARLKVIIEAALLSVEEKVKACTLAVQAGADYVKTSTGFGPGGATVEDVALIRRVVGEEIGVKAAGGIRDLRAARELIAAGASRIGTSSSVKIVLESRSKPAP
jgi:deoxyribose-phosphate aldolase